MASNHSTPPSDGASLSFMEALSPATAYFDPGTARSSTVAAARDPELIVFCSWMGARDAHIAKYIARHRALFPSARILLLRCPVGHVFSPVRAFRDTRLAVPYVEAVLAREAAAEKLQPQESRPPRVLVHAFSNGGISTAIRLYDMLRSGSGSAVRLPRHVLIMDSCPGNFRWRSTHNALMQLLPWWLSPLIHAGIAVMQLIWAVLRVMPAQNRNAAAIRAPGLRGSEVRRTYMYGTADTLILCRDVEDHAARAREAGFAVRMERFEGALHVACARQDGERYWRAVQESWDGGEVGA